MSVKSIFPIIGSVLATVSQAQSFAIKDGDRVVFYGDSITEQRLYTVFVEAYIVTRFPKMNLTFHHSGVGGDTVGGGWAGPIDSRLNRDVFPYQPTVITIMLGMNDGHYRPFEQPAYDSYKKGYEHIVQTIKQKAPNARMTFVIPSSFDDITRPLSFEGGYNKVLLKMADFYPALASQFDANLADLNKPINDMLTKAKAENAELSTHIIEDRVHPGAAGHVVMAGGILDAWHAPSLVSSVTVTADGKNAHVDHAKAENLKAEFDGTLTWSQTDEALPFPVQLADPIVSLAVRNSDFVQKFDQQIVKVTGLDLATKYELTIDGQKVTEKSGGEWGEGVNIATLPSPMLDQSMKVLDLIHFHTQAHEEQWKNILITFRGVTAARPERNAVIEALENYDTSLFAEAKKLAIPTKHAYKIRKVS